MMRASILIADDYTDNRELLRLVLAAAGYRIREARDGREALAMAREELPDLLLVDLSMPVLDGWGVLREVRADESMSGLPLVAITAFADVERARALAEGFSGYVGKPFRSQELLETVGRLLAESRSRKQADGGGSNQGAL
jgi:CheY-like chemotaxis protein